jgi:hypothetical protein
MTAKMLARACDVRMPSCGTMKILKTWLMFVEAVGDQHR